MRVFAPAPFRFPSQIGQDYPYGFQDMPEALAYILKQAGLVTDALSTGGSVPVSITGNAAVGGTLTASVPTGWTATGFQWTRNGSNISGATSSTYTLVSADANTVIDVVVAATQTAVGISVPGQGAATIGGVAIGAAGAGIFSGFTLITGDDFDTLPTRFNGINIGTAKYASDTPQSGKRRLSVSPYNIDLDPGWRGWHSDSPTPLGIEPMSVASSVLSIMASPVNSGAGYYAYLPTTYDGSSAGKGDGQNKPRLISGCLDTWPSFLVSAAGDFCFFVKASLPAAVARGFLAAFWTTTISNWPDYGEIDLLETLKDSSTGANSYFSHLHESITDGGGDINSGAGQQIGATRSAPSATMVIFGFKKQGNTLTMYDDIATPGSLAQVGTYTNAIVGRVRAGHRIRLDMNVSSILDGSTFNIADWPQGISVDWWQCWVPTAAYAPVAAPVQLTAINAAPGGSWAASFPSAATLYGYTPDIEERQGAFDNEDCPGAETVSGALPGGMTVDLTARTVSGTIPTTRGGATSLMLSGSRTAGGQAKQAFLRYNVAPAAQASLFGNLSATYGQSVSQALAFADFHSGNLGPHTYTVTNDSGGWLTTAYGSNNWSATLSGTAPGANQTVTITIVATNAIGQTTTVTRTLAVAATASTFSDNFNRTDQDLNTSPNWTLLGTAVGKARIVSNVVQSQTTDGVGAAYGSTDLASQRQAVSGNVSYSGFLCVQLTDASNFIGVRANSVTGAIEVYKRVSGTLTMQCGFAETVTFSDVVELDFISNTLTVKKNGTTLTPMVGSLTVSGGPAASTRTGIVVRLNNGVNFCDNYSAAVI